MLFHLSPSPHSCRSDRGEIRTVRVACMCSTSIARSTEWTPIRLGSRSPLRLLEEEEPTSVPVSAGSKNTESSLRLLFSSPISVESFHRTNHPIPSSGHRRKRVLPPSGKSSPWKLLRHLLQKR